ncbi:hypothetical protein KM043_008784 [Ampulex compressa]|nr:hypothetical protein KM043_008784 [Ampulex compressa]
MKAWRESASLIIAARQNQIYNRATSSTDFRYNYNLLSLKRHQKSNFAPGYYVFPGGVVDPADADLKWNDLFAKFGFDKTSFAPLFSDNNARPQILQSRPNELPKEISLRITAIRETFEECGLLLCKRSKDPRNLCAQHAPVSERELQNWQAKVHTNATEFYTLCERFKCYPDLWSLHEWSNWLTPTYFTGKRYDTMFFLACMPYMPTASFESLEMEDLKWGTPKNFLDPTAKVKLPPPQQYEIGRIAKFESIDNLLDFAIERSKVGVQTVLPVRIQLRDGFIHTLPGDSMYPKSVSWSEKQVIDRTDVTLKELREMSPVINRVEFTNLEVQNVFVQNFASIEGHVSPIASETVLASSAGAKL